MRFPLFTGVLLTMGGVTAMVGAAQAQEISEVQRWPLAEDITWFELFYDGEAAIPLAGWRFETDLGEAIELDGELLPGKYTIFPSEEIDLAHAGTVTLYDAEGIVIDKWVLEVQEKSGQSLIQQDLVLATDLPTAGRPNILYEKPMSCPEDTNNLPTEEPPPPVEEEIPELPPLQSGAIALTELLANPLGDEMTDEFIELYNADTQTINLRGWSISDATKAFTFSELSIEPGQHLAIYRPTTGLALNNTDETVTLTDPFGMVVTSYAYASTTEGLSFNANELGWYEAEPTPGAPNALPPAEPEPEPVPEANHPETPTETEQNPEPVEPPTPPAPPIVILNELLPNPLGSDTAEWIELYNPSDSAQALGNLSVTDGSTTFTFSDQSIAAHGYWLLHQTESKIALNNAGDALQLLFGGQIIDSFTYTSSQEGFAWARLDNATWVETEEPTPGAMNSMPQPEPQEITAPEPEQIEEVVAASVRIEDWAGVPDKSMAMVSGIITVLPGPLTKRKAIIQSQESAAEGIEIYFHKAEWPALSLYEQVTVHGEKSVTSKGTRLLVRAMDDIVVAGSTGYTPPWLTSIDELLHNNVIRVEGTIIESKKNQMLIDVDGEELVVNTKGIEQAFEEQTLISITGLARLDAKGWSLQPRGLEDITVEAQATPMPAPSPDIDPISVAPEPDRIRFINRAIIALSSLTILACALYHFKDRLKFLSLKPTA